MTSLSNFQLKNIRKIEQTTGFECMVTSLTDVSTKERNRGPIVIAYYNKGILHVERLGLNRILHTAESN